MDEPPDETERRFDLVDLDLASHGGRRIKRPLLLPPWSVDPALLRGWRQLNPEERYASGSPLGGAGV